MGILDLINGLFETCGGFFIALSVRKLHRTKRAEGVHWLHAGFFMSWGWWNLFYYPSLGQWLSFAGGVLIVTLNTIWLLQILMYSRAKNLDWEEN